MEGWRNLYDAGVFWGSQNRQWIEGSGYLGLDYAEDEGASLLVPVFSFSVVRNWNFDPQEIKKSYTDPEYLKTTQLLISLATSGAWFSCASSDRQQDDRGFGEGGSIHGGCSDVGV